LLRVHRVLPGAPGLNGGGGRPARPSVRVASVNNPPTLR
jgi:hypothetical protein